MLIKTVVDENFDNAVGLKKYSLSESNAELSVAEIDCDDAFVKSLAEEVSDRYVHITNIYDYESSTDAGDGRDDYSKEESDAEITLDNCIVKDGKLFGIVCKAFEKEAVILISDPKKICIGHPGNYGGRGYHFYRYMYFELCKK